MTEYADLALLPEGLHDDLPPTAAYEARTIEGLIGCFEGHGYERVKPPLMEFEESLLAGPGAQVSRHMFRLMDPISQRMMALRADMTPQVGRIAATRLQHVARPVRLCYAGQVLRVRGSQLRPERQFAQAGAELIGTDTASSDAEAALLAAVALAEAGVKELSVDLTTPGLVPALCAAAGLEGAAAESARAALDRKDGAGLAGLPAEARTLLSALLEAAGPVEAALRTLRELRMPAAVRPMVQRLEEVAALLGASSAGLRLTVDPGESRGFEYETGVSFALFARRVRGELGRGGRYALATGEAATGFTLYLDSVMRALPQLAPSPKLYLPFGPPSGRAKEFRERGWRVLRGLEPEADAKAEARRLGCSHILGDGGITEL
jgi:ATP phosphoribosyltransferase regulatory subunit